MKIIDLNVYVWADSILDAECEESGEHTRHESRRLCCGERKTQFQQEGVGEWGQEDEKMNIQSIYENAVINFCVPSQESNINKKYFVLK